MTRWFWMSIGPLMAVLIITAGCNKSNPSNSALPGTPPARMTADLYVSPTGNDANDGRSPEQALKTVMKALTLARPGQVILVLAGTYSESIEVENLGSDGGTITVRGDMSGGNRPVFDGGDEKDFFFWCWSNCVGLVFEHLEIENYRWVGMNFYQSRNISLEHLEIEHTGFEKVPEFDFEYGVGISLVECSDCSIEHTRIVRTGNKTAQNDSSGGGITVWGSRNTSVRNNHVESVIGHGILVEDSCNVTVEENRVEQLDLRRNDWFDGSIWLDGGRDILVKNNHLINSNGPGIEISDSELQYPNRSIGYRIEGNESADNTYGIYIWNFGRCPPPDDAVRLVNNQFHNNHTKDNRCEAWGCGEGEPCVEPDRTRPC